MSDHNIRLLLTSALFWGPPLVFKLSPRSKLGNLAGWLFALMPGLIVIYVVSAIIQDSGAFTLYDLALAAGVSALMILILVGLPFIAILSWSELGSEFDHRIDVIYLYPVLKLLGKDVESDEIWSAIPPVDVFQYRDYLQSDEWAERRAYMLDRSDYQCSECGRATELEVHHLTYKRIGNERISDLLVLCRDCHGRRHAR